MTKCSKCGNELLRDFRSGLGCQNCNTINHCEICGISGHMLGRSTHICYPLVVNGLVEGGYLKEAVREVMREWLNEIERAWTTGLKL